MTMRIRQLTGLGAVALGGLSLAACVSPQYSVRGVDRATAAPAIPQTAGRRQVGKPYQIKGKWYTPQEDPNYNEVGLASWYGNPHNGRPTANGETFDMSLWTGAHKTLPLPSMVEVTNLDNGRSMKLRINDRGPFVDGRIVDLSKSAADELGMVQAGIARVRVRYLGPAPLEAATQVARREPASRPATPQAANYEVQAGTFAERGAAERAADLIGDAGVAELRPVERNGATVWRVVVVSIPGASRAAQVRDQVAAYGLPDAKVFGPL